MELDQILKGMYTIPMRDHLGRETLMFRIRGERPMKIEAPQVHIPDREPWEPFSLFSDGA
jgi:hypothetical protein